MVESSRVFDPHSESRKGPGGPFRHIKSSYYTAIQKECKGTSSPFFLRPLSYTHQSAEAAKRRPEGLLAQSSSLSGSNTHAATHLPQRVQPSSGTGMSNPNELRSRCRCSQFRHAPQPVHMPRAVIRVMLSMTFPLHPLYTSLIIPLKDGLAKQDVRLA